MDFNKAKDNLFNKTLSNQPSSFDRFKSGVEELATRPETNNRDRSFIEAETRAKVLMDYANDIYSGSEDPRSEASAELLARCMAEIDGSNDYTAIKNSLPQIFKASTGYDIDAKSVWEICGNKFSDQWSNTMLGLKNMTYMLDTTTNDYSDEEREYKKAQYDEYIKEGMKNRRTDYYKEFDSLFDDLLLSSSSFAASMLPTVALNATGLLASWATGSPMFATLARYASGAWMMLAESGNASLELRNMGIDDKVALPASLTYGLISGAIEVKAGEYVQSGVLGALKHASELSSKTARYMEKGFVAKTIGDYFKRSAGEYAMSFLTEPTEEMLQDIAQNLITNMAITYQKQYGEVFADTKTLDEIARSAGSTLWETLKGNVFLGLGGSLASFAQSEAFGELKYIRHGETYAGAEFYKEALRDKSVKMADARQIVRYRDSNGKTISAVKPNADGSVGEIRGWRLPNGMYLIHPEDAGKAEYIISKAGTDRNGQVKGEGFYIRELDEADSSNVEGFSDFDTAVMGINTGMGGIRVDGNTIYTDPRLQNTLVERIINDNKEQFKGIQINSEMSNRDIGENATAEQRISILIGDRKVDVVGTQDMSKGESMLDFAESRGLDSVMAEKARQNEESKTTSEDLQKGLDFALERANINNSRKRTKANIDYAKNVLIPQFKNNYKADSMTDKRATAFANASVVFANRLANALDMSLEEFLGNYEIGQISDEEVAKIKQQKNKIRRGDITFAKETADGITKGLIRLSKAVDGTTASHEISHLFLDTMEKRKKGGYRNIKGFSDVYKEQLKEDNAIKDKDGNITGYKDEAEWKVGEATQEAFATDFETYIRRNEVKDSSLKKIFDQLKLALLGFRAGLKQDLDDATKSMLDELLGEDNVIDAEAQEDGLYESEDIRATEINTPQELTSNLKKQNDGTYLLSEDVEYPSDYVISPRQLLYAYHGSGVSFDEFMEKYVGNANGTTFGWGLYFSMSHLIAKDYAQNSGFTKETTDKHIEVLEKTILPNINAYGERIEGFLKEIDNLVSGEASVSEETIKEIEEIISSDPDLLPENIMAHGEEGELEIKNRLLKLVEGLKNDNIYGVIELEYYLKRLVDDNSNAKIEKELYLRQLQGVKESGDFIDSYNLYKIRIPSGKYLDWDTAFSVGVANELRSELIGRGYAREAKQFEYWDEDNDPIFGEVYDYLSSFMSKREVSKMFESLGYKGIVYDAGQIWGLGGAEEGTKNIVLFNQDYANENIVNHWKYTDLSEQYRLASEEVASPEELEEKFVPQPDGSMLLSEDVAIVGDIVVDDGNISFYRADAEWYTKFLNSKIGTGEGLWFGYGAYGARHKGTIVDYGDRAYDRKIQSIDNYFTKRDGYASTRLSVEEYNDIKKEFEMFSKGLKSIIEDQSNKNLVNFIEEFGLKADIDGNEERIALELDENGKVLYIRKAHLFEKNNTLPISESGLNMLESLEIDDSELERFRRILFDFVNSIIIRLGNKYITFGISRADYKNEDVLAYSFKKLEPKQPKEGKKISIRVVDKTHVYTDIAEKILSDWAFYTEFVKNNMDSLLKEAPSRIIHKFVLPSGKYLNWDGSMENYKSWLPDFAKEILLNKVEYRYLFDYLTSTSGFAIPKTFNGESAILKESIVEEAVFLLEKVTGVRERPATFGEWHYGLLYRFIENVRDDVKKEISRALRNIGYIGNIHHAARTADNYGNADESKEENSEVGIGLGGELGNSFNCVIFDPERDLKEGTALKYHSKYDSEFELASEDPADTWLSNIEASWTDILNRGGYLTGEQRTYLRDLAEGSKVLAKDLGVKFNIKTAEDLLNTEDTVIALFETNPDLIDMAKTAIDEQARKSKKEPEDFTNEDWQKAGALWNKARKVSDTEAGQTRRLLAWTMKRINDFLNMDNAQASLTSWLNKFRDTQRGNTALDKLARDLAEKTNYLTEGTVATGDINKGESFYYMALLANRLQHSKKVTGTDPDIQRIRNGARKELYENAPFFRDAWLRMNDSGAQADLEKYQNEMSEEVQYNEDRRRINEYLYDKNLDPNIKRMFRESAQTGEIVKGLLERNQRIQKQIDKQTDQINTLKGRLAQSTGDNSELKARIRELETLRRKAYKEMFDRRFQVLFERMRRDIDKQKVRLREITRKGGDAKTQNSLKRVYNILKKSRKYSVSLCDTNYTPDYYKDAIPVTWNYLVNNNVIDENGNVLPAYENKYNYLNTFAEAEYVEAFDTLTKQKIDGLVDAFRADSRLKSSERKAQEETRHANNLKQANKVSAELEERTAEDEARIDEKYTELIIKEAYSGLGEEINDLVTREDAEIALMERYGVDKFNEISDRINEQAKAYVDKHRIDALLRKGSISDAMKDKGIKAWRERFKYWNRNPVSLIKQMSPELYKIIFGDRATGVYGLNDFETNYWRGANTRIDRLNNHIADILGLTAKNTSELNKIVREELGKRYLENYGAIVSKDKEETSNLIDLYLDPAQRETARNLMKRTIYEEAVNTSDYTYNQLMGIYIRTLNNRGLVHLATSTNNISIGQAMAVRELFEKGEGIFGDLKRIADSIVAEIGSEYQTIADITRKLDNHELKLEPFYYPDISIDHRVQFDIALTNYTLNPSLTDFFIMDTQNGGDTPVNLDVLTDFEYQIIAQERYIHGAEFFRNLDDMMNGETNLLAKIEATHGKIARSMVQSFISINKNRVRSDLDEIGDAVGKIRSNISMAKLGFNLSTVFQQGSSLLLALQKYSPAKITASFGRVLAGGQDYIDVLYEISPQLRRRNQMELGYAKALTDYSTKYGRIKHKVLEMATWAMEKSDHFIAAILFDVAYQDNLSKGMESDVAEEQATQWVMNIQSNTSPKNNPLIYSSTNSLVKLLTLFTNQLNKQYNMVVDGFVEGGFKNIAGSLFAVTMSVLYVCLATGKFLPTDPDEETWKRWLKAVGTESLGMVPIVGSSAKGVFEGYAYGSSDLLGEGTVQKLLQVGTILAEEDKGKKAQKIKTALKNLVYSAEDLAGAPSVATKRFVQAIEMKKEGYEHFYEYLSPFAGSAYKKYWESR